MTFLLIARLGYARNTIVFTSPRCARIFNKRQVFQLTFLRFVHYSNILLSCFADIAREHLDDPLCIKNIDGKVLTDNEIVHILIPDKTALFGDDGDDEGEVDEEGELENGLRGL